MRRNQSNPRNRTFGRTEQKPTINYSLKFFQSCKKTAFCVRAGNFSSFVIFSIIIVMMILGLWTFQLYTIVLHNSFTSPCLAIVSCICRPTGLDWPYYKLIETQHGNKFLSLTWNSPFTVKECNFTEWCDDVSSSWISGCQEIQF